MPHENRIPSHYSKRHTFWVGQEGCGYAQKRDEGKRTNIQLLYRIPNGDCIKRHSYWLGRVILAIGSQTRDRFHPYSPRSIQGW